MLRCTVNLFVMALLFADKTIGNPYIQQIKCHVPFPHIADLVSIS